MSEFDAMAQIQFAEIACKRLEEGRPLPIIVIDPVADEATKERFRRVFRFVDFEYKKHEYFDWNSLLPKNSGNG